MKDDQGNKVKVTESQFLVITKDEYYNSRWAKWTDPLNFGRMEELSFLCRCWYTIIL